MARSKSKQKRKKQLHNKRLKRHLKRVRLAKLQDAS